MPAGFPSYTPKLLKGALVVYESHRSMASPKVIQFQYNPDQLSRRLTHRSPRVGTETTRSRGEAQEDVLRVEGAPRESITLTVIVNAADQLEVAQPGDTVVVNGLHPVLATLERLLYPTSEQVRRNDEESQRGAVQLASASLPLTLFVWGATRVVPVMVSSLSVTEEAFDPLLNPIRARVEMGLQVLTDADLPAYSNGVYVYKGYWKMREVLSDLYPQAGPAAGVLGQVRIVRALGE